MSVYEGKVAGHKFKGSGTIANGYAWIYNSTTKQFELTDLATTYAPVGADYLVGTTQSGLTGEIVVGTTPGGELGGTWASPTVDATHSGSAHHAETHATAHQNAGADEVSVTGLSGLLADAQTPTVHSSIQAAGSAVAGGLYEVVINLTNDQILALFSSPVQILAAPGANLVYQIVTATFILDKAGGAYSGSNVVNIRLGTTIASGNFAAALFNTAGGSLEFLGQVGTMTKTLVLTDANQAMNLGQAVANFTGGNAANKATVRVLYRILSTLPN